MIKEHLRTQEKLAWESTIKSSINTGATLCSGRGSALRLGCQGIKVALSFAPSCSEAETLPPTKICSSPVLEWRNLPSTLRDDRAPAYRHLGKLRRWLSLKSLSYMHKDLTLMLLNAGKKAGCSGMYLYFQVCANRLWRIPG